MRCFYLVGSKVKIDIFMIWDLLKILKFFDVVIVNDVMSKWWLFGFFGVLIFWGIKFKLKNKLKKNICKW